MKGHWFSHLILSKTNVCVLRVKQSLRFLMCMNRTNRLIVGASFNMKRIKRKEEPAPLIFSTAKTGKPPE